MDKISWTVIIAFFAYLVFQVTRFFMNHGYALVKLGG